MNQSMQMGYPMYGIFEVIGVASVSETMPLLAGQDPDESAIDVVSISVVSEIDGKTLIRGRWQHLASEAVIVRDIHTTQPFTVFASHQLKSIVVIPGLPDTVILYFAAGHLINNGAPCAPIMGYQWFMDNRDQDFLINQINDAARVIAYRIGEESGNWAAVDALRASDAEQFQTGMDVVNFFRTYDNHITQTSDVVSALLDEMGYTVNPDIDENSSLKG